MNTFQKMLSQPSGRIGLIVGLMCGFIATVMGAGSTALLFVGVFRLLAGRFGR